MFHVLRIFNDLLDGPRQGRAKRLVHHSAAGFADGRQSMERPCFRTVVEKLAHQQTVRQHDQVHVPGLALAIAQLTVSHAQLLLTVPMKGLRACPAISIHIQDPLRFPTHAVGNQDFTRTRIAPMVPENQNAYFVIHFGKADRAGEVPLPLVATPKFFARFRRDGGGQCFGFDFLAAIPNLAIHFQVAHVTARLAEAITLGMHMVEVLDAGKIAVPGKISRNVAIADPVDQLTEEHAVIFKRLAVFFALLAFLEASEFQRVMLAAGTDVIDEQIVVGDLVAVFGVIPEPTHVVDQLAFVIDQHVVDGDHALVAIARRVIALQDFQTPFVELLLVPDHVGEEPVKARLIGGVGELTVDGRHVFLACDQQARDVFGKVLSLRLAGKEVGEVGQRFENDVRKFDNRGHGQSLHNLCAPSKTTDIKNHFSHAA